MCLGPPIWCLLVYNAFHVCLASSTFLLFAITRLDAKTFPVNETCAFAVYTGESNSTLLVHAKLCKVSCFNVKDKLAIIPKIHLYILHSRAQLRADLYHIWLAGWEAIWDVVRYRGEALHWAREPIDNWTLNPCPNWINKLFSACWLARREDRNQLGYPLFRAVLQCVLAIILTSTQNKAKKSSR